MDNLYKNGVWRDAGKELVQQLEYLRTRPTTEAVENAIRGLPVLTRLLTGSIKKNPEGVAGVISHAFTTWEAVIAGTHFLTNRIENGDKSVETLTLFILYEGMANAIGAGMEEYALKKHGGAATFQDRDECAFIFGAAYVLFIAIMEDTLGIPPEIADNKEEPLIEWMLSLFQRNNPIHIQENPWEDIGNLCGKLLLKGQISIEGDELVPSLLTMLECVCLGNFDFTKRIMEGFSRNQTVEPENKRTVLDFTMSDFLHFLTSEEKSIFMGQMLHYKTIGEWLKTGKTVIEVSPKSLETLRLLQIDRMNLGGSPLDLPTLPLPGNRYYKQTIAFKFVDIETEELKVHHKNSFYSKQATGNIHKITPKPVIYVFVHSDSVVLEESVRIFTTARPSCPIHQMALQFMPWIGGFDSINVTNWKENVPTCVFEKSTDRFHPNVIYSREVVFAAVNALCAMASNIEVVERKKRNKKEIGRRGGRKRTSRGQTLRLDDKGIRTWSKKIIFDSQIEHEVRKLQHKKRKMGLQIVPETMAKVWVLSPQHGEEVLGEKPRHGKARGYLYCVRRHRDGFTRGGEINPVVSRLKQGLDDLNMPTWVS